MISVGELRSILKSIDNCQGRTIIKAEDGAILYDEECTAQCMCDSCIEKFMGLLQWAEDDEESDTPLKS